MKVRIDDPQIPADVIEMPDGLNNKEVADHMAKIKAMYAEDTSQEEIQGSIAEQQIGGTAQTRSTKLSPEPPEENIFYDADGHLHPQAGKKEDIAEALRALRDKNEPISSETDVEDENTLAVEIAPGTVHPRRPTEEVKGGETASYPEALERGTRELGVGFLDLATMLIETTEPIGTVEQLAKLEARRKYGKQAAERIRNWDKPTTGWDEHLGSLEKARKAISPEGEFQAGEKWSPTWWGLQITRAAPQYMGQILATAAGGPVTGALFIGGQIAGRTYADLREKGVGKSQAAEAAYANAALQSVLEQYGIDKMMKAPMSKKATGRLVRMIKSMGREGFTEALQQAPDYISRLAGKSSGWEDFTKQLADTDWSQQLEQAGAAAGVGAALGGAGDVSIQVAQEAKRKDQEPVSVPQDDENLSREQYLERVQKALDQRAEQSAQLQQEAEQAAREEREAEEEITFQEGRVPPLFNVSGAPGTNNPEADVPAGFMAQLTEETIHDVPVDQFNRWPVALPKPSQALWPSLMEFTREVGGEMGRYKYLPENLKGLFKPQTGRIQLQDVTETLTLAHEAGHMLDWKIQGDRFPPDLKKRFPEHPATESTLRSEATTISKHMRPQAWGHSKMIPYLKKPQELMADFFASYIHAPENTRQNAPNLTEALEVKLRENPIYNNYVEGLIESAQQSDAGIADRTAVEQAQADVQMTTTQRIIHDMRREGYQEATKNLLLRGERQRRAEAERVEHQANQIDKLVSQATKQQDLVAAVERTDNPWTGRSIQEINREINQNPNMQEAKKLYQAFMEQSRQTANKFISDVNPQDADYFNYVKDYVMHLYEMDNKRAGDFAGRWQQQSRQAKPRKLPTLQDAVEAGFTPKTMGVADMLRKWNDINQKIAVQRATVQALKQITNQSGELIIQKPSAKPEWPTIDHHAIRKVYAQPLKDKKGQKTGDVLVQHGRIAVDPQVSGLLQAYFGQPFTADVFKYIEGLNAVWMSIQLTALSFFHHQVEALSTMGGLRTNIFGFWGSRAEEIAGANAKRILGVGPKRIGVRKAADLLRNSEIARDAIMSGVQFGRIRSEGINIMERKLREIENKISDKITSGNKAWWVPFVPVKSYGAFYRWMQNTLWNNVDRVKMATYYKLVADGAMHPNGLTITEIKEKVAQQVNNNYGGQEFMNTVFRHPKTNWVARNSFMSIDWTWSQIKNGAWPIAVFEDPSKIKKANRTPVAKEKAKFMRKLGRLHWFGYILAISTLTMFGNLALNGRWPWENERGHKFDVDYTRIWRNLPWNNGMIGKSWKERGDYNRRYISLGKAGRELARWLYEPIKEFGNKLSPTARWIVEQLFGHGPGSKYPMPWREKDLTAFDTAKARLAHTAKQFQPFSLSGGTALLSFPMSQGMTAYQAIMSYHRLYRSVMRDAVGKWTLPSLERALVRDRAQIEQQIFDACMRNGVNPIDAQEAAIAKVRSTIYDHIAKAGKNDPTGEEMERWARAAERFNIEPDSIKQSMEQRSQWHFNPKAVSPSQGPGYPR